jgi:hypothetical protein
MFKTISAAVLAVSVLAAPAFAAGKIAQTPAKDAQAQTPAKKAQAKNLPVKSSVLNANAKMGKHSAKHARHHVKHATKRTHHTKVSFKHPAQVTAKRG